MITPFKSKTITALLAFFLGCLGAHRFYLRGAKDIFGWTHLAATGAGYAGFLALQNSENLASTMGWVGAVIGVSGLLIAFLSAIVFGLRPDERWDAQFNANSSVKSASGWTVVLTVIASLIVGAIILMSGLAFSFQTFFESQIEAGHKISQGV